MKREKLFIMPRLHDYGGDMKKKWFVFYSYRNPNDGKMTRFRTYEGFGRCYTKKARYNHAEKVIKDLTEKLSIGWNPFVDNGKVVYNDSLQYAAATRIYKTARTSAKTFNYYSNLFLPQIKGMSPKTYQNYQSKFRTFDAWLASKNLADNDISAITPTVMQEFFMFLIEEKQYARITIGKYKQFITKMFDWCVNQGYILASPVINLPETSRINDCAPRPINESDIDRFVEAIRNRDRQLWLTVQLEYYCFMRPGKEIRLARIGWFDLARGIISVPADITKTHENKNIIIPEQFRQELINEWHLDIYPGDFYLISQNGIPGPRPVGSNNMRERFNKIRDDLKLPKTYKLYSFKHTGNVRAAYAGIPAYHRQLQNGHASMRSLEEYIKNKIGFESKELQHNFPSL